MCACVRACVCVQGGGGGRENGKQQQVMYIQFTGNQPNFNPAHLFGAIVVKAQATAVQLTCIPKHSPRLKVVKEKVPGRSDEGGREGGRGA